jgi:hypothetical protein
MSKHISRKKRWTRVDAKTHRSPLGKVVYERNAWYGVLEYKTMTPPEGVNSLPGWATHSLRLGPCKRPRDAMVALEREAIHLRNRHGEDLLLGEQIWAET